MDPCTALKNKCAAYQNLLSMPTYSCAFCRPSQIGEHVYCRGTSDGGCRCYVIGIQFLTLWFRRPIGTFLSITA